MKRPQDLTNFQSPDDGPFAKALRGRTDARKAFTELRGDLRAVGRIFGTALEQELHARVERGVDCYEDAFHEVSAAWDSADRRVVEAERRTQTLAARVSELHNVVIDSALELQRRFAVARKPVPTELVALVEAGGGIWPFVYSPDDARHEHDHDGAGACRNPCCGHVSEGGVDYEEEPF